MNRKCGLALLLLLATPRLGFSAPVGSIEGISATGLITGIARDSEGSGVIIEVSFYENLRLIGAVMNDFAGHFSFQLPETFLDNHDHFLDVIMRESGYGPTAISGSPFNVNVGPPGAAGGETTTFTLSWIPGAVDALHEPAQGFYVYRDGQRIAEVRSTVYVDTIFYPAGSRVCYSVSAFNGAGESIRSNELCGNVASRAPNPPTLITR